MSDSIKGVLAGWIGQKATVINPQSYQKSALREQLGLEVYEVEVKSVGDDVVLVGFEAKKTGETVHVEQYIPFHDIRRLSVWGDEKFIQI
jgi:hypothetical protein